MTSTSSQTLDARAAGIALTRERILRAATVGFTERWYDEVTMRGVAAEAGVALQTVINHFPTKEALFADAMRSWGDRIEAVRMAVAPGDIGAAIDVLVDDYESTGDTALRLQAVEHRVDAVKEPLDRGRAGHQAWVELVFSEALRGRSGPARRRRSAQLVVATDVYTWKLLRRDRRFSVKETKRAMTELVAALHRAEGDET